MAHILGGSVETEPFGGVADYYILYSIGGWNGRPRQTMSSERSGGER